MSYCNQIKKSIDQAERPDVVTFETAGHLTGCPDCRAFADERARLRELLATSGRVGAPVNFDAVLNERLQQVKAKKAVWVTPFGFVKLGAATAGIVLAVFVTQYSGVFEGTQQIPSDLSAGESNLKEQLVADGDKAPEVPDKGHLDREASYDNGLTIAVAAPPGGSEKPVSSRRSGGSKINRDLPKATDTPAYPVFILRDQDREFTVPMMTVSVGMQQQVLNSSGRPSARSLETSY